MNTKLIGLTAALALAAPAVATAAPPTPQDRTNASQECRAERGTTAATREAFAAKYRTFGACVSAKAREERTERKQARADAETACRAEQTADHAAFAAKYGSGKKGNNALPKCIQQATKAKKADMDAKDAERAAARRNAAQTCRTERGSTDASRAAFAARYGTNSGGRNAFGRCVSQTAKAQSPA